MTTMDHKCEAIRLLSEAENHIAAAEHESAEIEQARIACRRAQQCIRAHHMMEMTRLIRQAPA